MVCASLDAVGPRPASPSRSGAALALPAALGVAVFALYLTVELSRYATGRSAGYDLGIFTQIVRHYASGQAPTIELKQGMNAWGDHFSPVLIVLAPVYRLFPSPVTLLVAQAALIALSAVPVGRFATQKFGVAAGAFIELAYGISYGLQSAVAFDFHEVAFAVPIAAYALEYLQRRRFRYASVLFALLVFVKEDLGLTAFVAGVIIASCRKRLGFAVMLWGGGWFIAATAFIVPSFTADDHYRSLNGLSGGRGLSVDTVLQPWTTPDIWMRTSFIVIAVTCVGFVALLSPVIALAVPTMGWRFVASNQDYWSTHYHYDAILMPVIFFAAIDGYPRLVRLARRILRKQRIVDAALRPAVFGAACLTIGLLQTTAGHYPFSKILSAHSYRRSASMSAAWKVAKLIPTGAVVRADNDIAPWLVSRTEVYAVHQAYGNIPRARWIILDLTRDTLGAPLAWKTRWASNLLPDSERVIKNDGIVAIELRQ